MLFLIGGARLDFATIRAAASATLISVLVAACGGGGGGGGGGTTGTTTQSFTVGGSVSGLTGTGLTLQDNAGDTLSVTADGTYTFATSVASGATYAVTVKTQPASPAQTCVVTNGSGTIGVTDVSTVTVACTTNTYTVGGTVSGLTGTGLVLQDNAGDNLSVTADGAFTFATSVASGAAYAVTVATQPSLPAQTCVVTDGSGTVGAANVTDVTVTCTTTSYTVGGSVSGLSGSGLVLEDNAGDNLAVSSNGSFTFATHVASGAAYAATVKTQPTSPGQTCVVTNGSGTVVAANVSNISVACTTNNYTISGSVGGLAGSGLMVQTNGANSVAVSSNGSYTFATLSSGTAYTVTVTQPTNPTQTCVVTNGSGTVTTAAITNVSIACTTNKYTVGGSVSGLTGTTGMVLRDNGGANLTVPANATSFTFATSVASGAPYAVTVLTQPTNPTQSCVVTGGNGNVGGANVTTVSIACTTKYTVGGTASGLTGTGLVLQDNAADNLAVSVNGSFTFATGLANSAAYAVTVLTQPTNPAQHCTVSNGSGNIAAANVTNVALSCENVGKFVFVANALDNTNGDVSAYTVDPNSGNLTPVSGAPYAADVHPSGIALDSSGPYLYVTNKGSVDITAYNVNTSTGALTAITDFSASSGSTMEAIAVTPSGLYAYSAGYGSGTGVGALDAFTINAGSLVDVTGSPYSAGDTPFAVAVDPASQFVIVPSMFHAQIRVFAIGSGGTLTPAPGNPFTTGTSPYGVAVYPGGGYVYVANNGDGTVSAYSYDSFGDLTSLGSAYPVGSQPKGLAMDAGGKFLYVANYGDGTVSAFTINASSGALTSVGPAVATGNLNSVANPAPIDVKVDPSGQYVYVANYLDGSVSLFSVNASTGALTLSNTFAAGTGATAVAVE